MAKEITGEEHAMFQNTLENFEKMPTAMKVQFCEATASIIEEESEEDKLSYCITKGMKRLKDDWKNFPEKWVKDDFQKVCAEARRIWKMLDRYDAIQAELKEEIIRDQANNLFKQVPFDRIEIEGQTFNFKESDKAQPPQLPDDDFPFR